MTEKEMIEPLLSPNAIKVLEKRYLAKNDKGQVTETPTEMFRREDREGVLRDHDQEGVPPQLPYLDECRPGASATFCMFRIARRRLDGGDFRVRQTGRHHP